MSGPLDHSVTLEDVFVVVNAKRVPLAPELAGYLTLEVAEGAQGQNQSGDVDPKSVYIGEEGSVALVRARGAAGDTEASIRAILLRLLEASGSATPALGAAARRRPGAGLPALVEELEGALIPVNRAAGRRALARLAREVKRVTAGVGRNAAPPDRPAAPRAATAAVGLPGGRQPPPQAAASRARAPEAAPKERAPSEPEPPEPEAFPDLADALPRASDAMPATVPVASAALPGSGEPSTPPPGTDAVDHLLASFEVSGAVTDRAVSRELKAMVGLEPTPPPPSRQTTGPTILEASSAGADGVEDLLAMTDQSIPIANLASAQARKGTPTGLGPPQSLPTAGAAAAPPPPRPPTPAEPAAPQALPPPPPKPPPARVAPTTPGLLPIAPQPPPVADAYVAPHGTADARQQPQYQEQQPIGPSRMGPRAGSRNAKTIVLPRELVRKRARRLNTLLALLTLVVLATGAVAIWMLKPGFFTGRTPEKLEQERRAAALASQQALAQQQVVRCRGALTVADVPQAAEVLMRLGQAPVDIDRMPVGARLEFVATAEGYAPKRAIVPAGATWDSGPDGKPRFELGVQLEPSRAKPGATDPWPAGQPGTVVGGKGAPGTVHVVSTPRGAELWLLVGAGPEATIDPIKCEQDAEILVAGPTTFRRRLKVPAADIAKAPAVPAAQGSLSGAHAVRVSAK